MVSRDVTVQDHVETVHEAFARALSIIEFESLVNPTVSVGPSSFCPCPEHNEDTEEGFVVTVQGRQYFEL